MLEQAQHGRYRVRIRFEAQRHGIARCVGRRTVRRQRSRHERVVADRRARHVDRKRRCIAVVQTDLRLDREAVLTQRDHRDRGGVQIAPGAFEQIVQHGVTGAADEDRGCRDRLALDHRDDRGGRIAIVQGHASIPSAFRPSLLRRLARRLAGPIPCMRGGRRPSRGSLGSMAATARGHQPIRPPAGLRVKRQRVGTVLAWPGSRFDAVAASRALS
ncbi:MAG: hypothetical protein DI564_16150 [Rhodanobacter denitrificans]|uniref:Uncharacterized protein n=1 Tax=Rhodanobacter denitrificans TaxID=666685 RepID=A0A2W5MAN0_9GAMM|nr:MAG: hypothetical protein DI564_16150 [Rhodanobacter denitrificans]